MESADTMTDRVANKFDHEKIDRILELFEVPDLHKRLMLALMLASFMVAAYLFVASNNYTIPFWMFAALMVVGLANSSMEKFEADVERFGRSFFQELEENTKSAHTSVTVTRTLADWQAHASRRARVWAYVSRNKLISGLATQDMEASVIMEEEPLPT